MTIQSYQLGPGTLTLGTGPLAVEQQLLGCKIVPSENVTTVEARKVLSGETLPAEETVTFSYTLQGKFLQSLMDNDVIDWSWTNKGTAQAFTFKPTGPSGAIFAGTIKPVPLQVGGDDIGGRPEADFTWRGVGELPTPTWDT